MISTGYKEVSCGVCLSTDKRILFPDTLQGKSPNFDYNFTPNHSLTYQTVRCLKCTHVYSTPLPNDIWKNYVSVEDQSYLKQQKSRFATSKKLCNVLRKHVPSGRLLDIGCATGDFMTIAKEFYQCEGLELSSWSAELAKSKGFKIHSEFLSAIKQSQVYDVITLWGVIEHFEYPRREVREMFRLLKPGGIVAIWTGDIDGFCSRILGKKWWNIQGQHIQDFSKRSLTKLYNEAGFEKEWIGTYPATMSRDAIMLSMGRYPTICKPTFPIIRKLFSPDFTLTLALPGEMFAIFRKPKNEAK